MKNIWPKDEMTLDNALFSRAEQSASSSNLHFDFLIKYLGKKKQKKTNKLHTKDIVRHFGV